MRSRLDVREGETHARDRPERRRQDHASSASSPASCARRRPRSSSPARTSPRFPRRSARAAGLARSFQITSIFPEFTALHNLRARRAGALGPCFRLLARCAAATRPDRAGEASPASEIGLAGRADALAGQSRARRAARSSRWRWRSPRARACSCSTSRWPAWAARNRSA